ncbi:Methyltransferase type 11 [Neofusicoccum parvum]|uniref:Methyltransferase type 11 n=1 Tax=Neofusicoccum parvum TaxID=310453 RepID=A0ACB5RQB4_9PEZI|nr:Methyltransferase type 11 [Neofusicoccum parvum]
MGRDDDSALGDSLTPSVTDYPEEHGRRYHAYRAGIYILPNDDKELERLDIMHFLIKKGLGDKIYKAPIAKDVKRIMDIGTGTGIWAIEMADMFPDAEVSGNDLSPEQPSWVPPNVKFHVDDVELDWAHSQKFDYIFSRYMATSIGDWPKLVKNVYNNLEPGGWAEFQDFDLLYYSDDETMNPDTEIYKWIRLILEASRKNGRDPCPGPKLEGWLKEQGFVNVHHERIKFPIGPWAKDKDKKELGMFNLMQTLQGLEGYTLWLFTHMLGWKKEEVDVVVAKVRNEVMSKWLHSQFDLHVVYGQKPPVPSAQPGKDAGTEALQFYPERYYSASPTYNTWVKLTAAGVHALRAAPSPTGAGPALSRTDNFDPLHPTFFHLNHPIRFIRLVGTVVAISDLAPRFALLTVDDGSGATLELKITRLADADNDNDASLSSTNTTVANVAVRAGPGAFAIAVDGAAVEVGTTVKAKCSLATWRGAVQGVLQRCWVLRGGTAAEAAAWRETAAFMRGVLARPWVLGADEVRRLERRVAREERRAAEEEGRAERKRAERARRKEEFYKERAEKMRVYEEKMEARRRKEELLMNKGALI